MIYDHNQQTIDTVADLVNLSVADGQIVNTLGYYSPGDGGGNLYRYSLGSSVNCDGGLIMDGIGGDNSAAGSSASYTGTSASGRFQAIDILGAYPEQFGADLGDPGDSFRQTAFTNSGASNPLSGLNNWSENGVNLEPNTDLIQNLGSETKRINTPFFGGHINYSLQSGITASTTQAQGQMPLTKDINEVSVVANFDDVVTMPASVPGTTIIILNHGANELQVFPASGDDLGAGVDAPIAIPNGITARYICYEDLKWQSGEGRRAYGAIGIEENGTSTSVPGNSTDFSQKAQVVNFDGKSDSDDLNPSAVDGHIEVVTPGEYILNFQCSIDGDNNDEYSISFFKNNGAIKLPFCRAKVVLNTNGDVQHMGIIALNIGAKGDTYEVWVQRESGGGAGPIFVNAYLTVARIGDVSLSAGGNIMG